METKSLQALTLEMKALSHQIANTNYIADDKYDINENIRQTNILLMILNQHLEYLQ